MRGKSNNGYGFTQERERYEMQKIREQFLPIENGIIQIGKHRGKKVSRVRTEDPSWFKWACETVQDFRSLADH